MTEPRGAEAVDHPRLFHGFPINTALDYKGEGPRCKLQSVTHDNMICATLFPWKTVPSSKKLIYITICCVVGHSVLESRFSN